MRRRAGRRRVTASPERALRAQRGPALGSQELASPVRPGLRRQALLRASASPEQLAPRQREQAFLRQVRPVPRPQREPRRQPEALRHPQEPRAPPRDWGPGSAEGHRIARAATRSARRGLLVSEFPRRPSSCQGRTRSAF